MGDFADMAIERDWNSSFDDENPYYNDSDRDYDVVNVEDYPKIDNDTLQTILNDKDGFILRKRNGSYNILVTCIWQGEKSFLCKIEDFGERNDVGRTFFCPKSIVRYNKAEKKVLYVPNWAKLKYLNK